MAGALRPGERIYITSASHLGIWVYLTTNRNLGVRVHVTPSARQGTWVYVTAVASLGIAVFVENPEELPPPYQEIYGL